MYMSPITLPTTASKLIRVALRDLRACEDDDFYVVDMQEWHTPVYNYDYEVCAVCLAGAVMAQTLGLPDDLEIDDTDLAGYGDSVKNGLHALDFFRIGEIKAGLETLGYDDVRKLSEDWQQYARKSGYDQADPEPFHRQMHRLADYFESCGL